MFGYRVRIQRGQSRIPLLTRSGTPLPLVLVRRAAVPSCRRTVYLRTIYLGDALVGSLVLPY